MDILNLPGGDSMKSEGGVLATDDGQGFHTAMLRLMDAYYKLPGPRARHMATTGVQLLTHYIRWAWGIEG